METIPEDQRKNYDIFRDCLSTALIEKISQSEPKPKKRSRSKKSSSSSQPTSSSANGEAESDLSNADALAEFADYIAAETFQALPIELKTLDHYAYIKDADLQARFALPLTGADIPDIVPALDPSVADTLEAYGVTHSPERGVPEFLAPILSSFLTTLSTPPPAPRATLADAEGCEMCERDWVPLSYHHLIPRFVHAKAVRRGWHREEDLQNVAWLCGACHRFVHRFAGHEELARKYYTVELLMGEEAVRRWVDWVGRLRWKGR